MPGAKYGIEALNYLSLNYAVPRYPKTIDSQTLAFPRLAITRQIARDFLGHVTYHRPRQD